MQFRRETNYNGIGVRVGESAAGSPIGARVAVTCPGGKQIARAVTGASFSPRHAATVQFGPVGASRVDAIDVEWSSGKKQRIAAPPIRRFAGPAP
jgi:hypothetical protein